jgi:type I restriction enzyme S subunit
LSDADALIESLEQLLVKKRHIKQGAMQELLSPKPSDEVRLLREVSSLKGRIGWQGLKQTEFTSNDNEPFLITGMNFKDGAIRWNEVYHIPEVRYDMAPEIQLRPDDVLMTKDGTIGKVLYIDAIPYPSKASLNSHLLLFRPIKNSYCAKYLYYQLGSRRFQDYIEQSKSGTTFFGLSQAAVGEYPVLLPPMTDQIRVAATLSDMDTEIATLESKLSKARQLKTGMMQELLTGKIRLVRPSASAVPFVVEQKASASPQRSHNAQFNEAVVIAVLVHGFGTEQFPLGRFRRMKFTYLLHRHIEHETEGFLKKAAGPYNPSIKYGGAEKIALKNGYVREHSSGKFEGFISGDNIAQAEEYFENWYGLDALAWMEQFRHKKNDDLELLTTVDMASEELRRAGRAVNLSTVKQVIRSNAEWKAKLDRPVFSDPNIISAIHSCELILDVEGDGS